MKRERSSRVYETPRPFLKWVGGKRQLLPELLERVEEAGKFGRYHEPFVGGGALFFALYRNKMLDRKKAYLSDNNLHLIEAYQGVKDHVEDVIELLKEHKANHERDYFYQIRATIPPTLPERAARIIYLNKTCFNGLYRENSKGQFNAPMGSYKNPGICDEENLRAVAEALKSVRIKQQHFENVMEDALRGDFVYFDPPYQPVSKTASFTGYHKGSFGEDSQRLLAMVFEDLRQKDVKALLSNSKTPLVEQLYKGFTIETVFATRLVNSRADRRGEVSEVLVRNY